MAVAAAGFGQLQASALDQTDFGVCRPVDDGAHARVATRRFKMDFDYRLGRGFQAHTDGVEAEQGFGGGYALIIGSCPP